MTWAVLQGILVNSQGIRQCSVPLGLSDGGIKDNQLIAPSAFNNDFNTFGPQRARLNISTWPRGYRADPAKLASSWLRVDLRKVLVVTEVATQGYGSEDEEEWLIQYMFLYSQGRDYSFFRNVDGSTQLFKGNEDRNTVQRNSIFLPMKALSVMLMPVTWHNNVAFRLELYGCEQEYYIVVWLEVAKVHFTRNLLTTGDEQRKSIIEDVLQQVTNILRNIPGFLDVHVQDLSPQESEGRGPSLTVEVVIQCLRASQDHLMAQLEKEIDSGRTIFQARKFQLHHTADEEKLLLKFFLNLNKTAAQATEIIPGEVQDVKVDLSSDQNTTALLESYDFIWEISTVDDTTGQFSPFVVLLSDGMNVTVSSKELFVGLTYIRLKAKPKAANGTISYDFGFVRLLPPLVAKIAGPKLAIKGEGLIRLDAEIFGEIKRNLITSLPTEFLWSCSDEDKRFVSNTSTSVNTSSFESGNGTRLKQCFVNTSGDASFRKRSLLINTNTMVAKRVYLFYLAVTQGRRSSVASHTLRVDLNISFTLVCSINCESKVSTRRKMVLESKCIGVSCSVIDGYQWTLFVRVNATPNNSWAQVENLDETITTPSNGPNLVFTGSISHNRSSFMGNKTYKLQVVAWIDRENYKKDDYIFHTNSPPYKATRDAGCSVLPNEGQAITTKFQIKCAGWKDVDLPLSYQYAYLTEFGVVVFHTGRASNATTELPMGKPESDFWVALQLEIIDFFGDAAVEMIMVKVRAPNPDSVVGVDQQVGGLLKSGNVDEAMQMAFAVLSVDQGKHESSVKSTLLNAMENIQVTSLQQATMVVGVLALATESEDGISSDSQDKALNLLGNSINFLSSRMGNSSVDTELVQSIGTSLLSGIGNVLDAASTGAESKMEKTVIEDINSDEVKEKSKQRAKNALSLASQMGNSLLATKTVGEKPSVFKTKSIEILLDRQLSSNMGGKRLGEGSSGISLPSASSLFTEHSQSSSQAVDSQMMSFNKNPFTWDKSAEAVTSSVLEFKLKTTDGDVLNISGLRDPIELFIPLPEKKTEPETNKSQGEHLFLKPSDGNINIRYHKFSIASRDILVTITIKPQGGRTVDVFVNYKSKPTTENKIFSVTIPDFSSCENTTENFRDALNCTKDPYKFSVSTLVTGSVGQHFLGIRYIPQESRADRTRLRRSCGQPKTRKKRSCVDVKDPPATPAPVPKIIMPNYNATTDINYTLSISVSGCLYWSESKEKWTGEGCRVGPKTNAKQLQCLCTHLSAFGGDFFVAPNPIDFDKVFAAFGNLAETGNFVVLSTVCAILGVYVIGLVIARREDRKDELKVVANVFINNADINNAEDEHRYHVSIQTGMWRGSGTTANVCLSIHGSDSITDAIPLADPQLGKQFFARASINNFTLSFPDSLGTLEKIRIWHDNSGDSPSWFLMQISIVDVAANEKSFFVANRWLAVEKSDGSLELDLNVADKQELAGFKNQFYSRTATNLGDGHLWLSVFTRPPHNPFTRVQRLACCVSILFAAMVTNAMFYQFGASPGDTVQIGPMKVSLNQIKIGIQSSLIAIPVNVLVVSIFRNIKPTATRNQDIAEEEVKGKGCLPFWFVVVAWLFCTLATLASATFIVFYSLMWGVDTSNEWLVSIMVSFFQDVVVMQPVKVVIVASILSILIKKPPEQEKVLGESLAGTGGRDVSRLGEAELEKARRFKNSLVQVGRQAMEIVFFFIFILLVLVVCYSNRGVERFMVTQSMKNLFQSFRRVYNIPSFWKWSKGILVPNLYQEDWYNNLPFKYDEGFLSNRAAFVVGMPRMRQLRVKPERTCRITRNEPRLGETFTRCIPFYSALTEDTTPYNKLGWLPVHNITKFYTEFELNKQCPIPWRYQSPSILGTRSIEGLKVNYVGGGFVADLGYNSRSAMKVLQVLESNSWIDDRTAAIFIEFAIFEPSSSLFSALKLLFERIPTGGSHAAVSIKTLCLYASPDPDMRSLFQVCQLLLMVVIICLIFAEIGKLRREKCAYFKQFWNWLEMVQIISTICSLVFFFLKEMQTSQFVKMIQENPFKTSSTDYIQFLSDLETYLLSFVIFIVTIKFLKLIKFNRHVCHVTGTWKRASIKVLSFMVVIVTIIMAYTQIGFLVFSNKVETYSSLFNSLRAMLLLIVGGEMHFHELQSTSRYIAPLFMFGYMSSMGLVLLNIFLAILNDYYEEVKHIEGDTFADAELGEFMKAYVRERMKKKKDETLKALGNFGHYLKEIVLKTKQDMPHESTFEEFEDFSDFELSVQNAKLASMESLDSIHSENSDSEELLDDSYPLVKLSSLHLLQEFDNSSLKDLRKSFLHIGQDLRQSLSSIRTAVSCTHINQRTPVYDFTKAMVWLEEDRALNYHGPSSYFAAFGSYIEDIWQKNRRSYQDLGKTQRRKRKINRDRETKFLLGK